MSAALGVCAAIIIGVAIFGVAAYAADVANEADAVRDGRATRT